MLMKMDREN